MIETSRAAPPEPAVPSIDQEALRLPMAWDAVLDVCFDEQRVWSIPPPPSGTPAGGDSRVVRWPKALRPYLNGHVRIAVVEHASARVLLEGDYKFGTGDGRVRVVNASGQPLSVSKNGRLQRTFDTGSTAVVASLLDNVDDVLQTLSADCGVPAFIAFGPLLGAVREGKFIGHDSDADVGYLSRYRHPLDVARESFHLQRLLRQRGFTLRRFSAADFKVLVTDADGGARGIDIFGGFMVEDRFYLMPNVRAAMPRSAILPLGEVTLHGRPFPAPAEPETLLEATYGPNWRVPDPSFKFRPPSATRRRLTGWMRGVRDNNRYWSEFYSSAASAAVPDHPSMFARWVREREPASRPLVDIAFGTGRDALWFARAGYRTLGLEYAPPAVTRAQAAAQAEDLPASFEHLNLYDLRQVLATGARLAQTQEPRTLYARFLLHALTDEGRWNLWRFAAMTLRAGGRLYLEFRTGKDAQLQHEFGRHFRRFLDPEQVLDEIQTRGGHVEYREESHGLAPYRNEDPHICRLIVEWRQ